MKKNEKTFHVYEISCDLIRALRPLVGRLDPDLRRQIKKAASSVVQNIGEGSRKRGDSRRNHFRIAAGSAEETRAALRVAEAWGYLSLAQTEAPLELVDSICAMLYRLTH